MVAFLLGGSTNPCCGAVSFSLSPPVAKVSPASTESILLDLSVRIYTNFFPNLSHSSLAQRADDLLPAVSIEESRSLLESNQVSDAEPESCQAESKPRESDQTDTPLSEEHARRYMLATMRKSCLHITAAQLPFVPML